MPYRDRAVDVFVRKVRQKSTRPRRSGPSSTRISASATASARSRGRSDGSSPLRYGGFTSWRAGAARVTVSMSRRRSSPPMKHRLPLVVAVALLAVAIPASTASARTTITMSGSTSVAPLAAKLAKGISRPIQASDVPARSGRLRRRRRRRRPGRVSIGNSSRDPQAAPTRAASCSTRSPATRSAS